MGNFFNPRNRKVEWAKAVEVKFQPGAPLTEQFLDMATDQFIQQHGRILYESIHLVLTSKNASTKKSRYKLAREHYRALLGVQKYANKNQKKAIRQAIDDFLIMEDQYKYPNKANREALAAQKKQKKNDFWETYAMMEMIDIFAGDDD